MKTRFFYFICVVGLLLLFSGCNRRPPVRDCREFMKEKIELGISKEEFACIGGGFLSRVNGKGHFETLIRRIQGWSPRQIEAYDFVEKKQHVVFEHSKRIEGFYPLSDDSVFVLTNDNVLELRLRDTVLTWDICKLLPLPKYGDTYVLHPASKDVIYYPERKLFLVPVIPDVNLVEDYRDSRTYLDRPQLLAFQIDGSRLKLVKYTGYFPLKYLGNNNAADGIYHTYNAKDDILIVSNEWCDKIWVEHLFDTLPAKEMVLGSPGFQPPPDMSYEEFMDLPRYIEYMKKYDRFSNVFYDPYRRVYLRGLTHKKPTDEKAIIKSDLYDRIWIVADENFKIKYKVILSDVAFYSPPIITEEGVYFFTPQEENKEKYDLTRFVFD